MLDQIMESASMLNEEDLKKLEMNVKLLSYKQKLMDLAFEPQKEVIKCDRNFVIVNSKRGNGKTFTMAMKILYDRPKYVEIKTINNVSRSLIGCKIKEIVSMVGMDFIKEIQYNKNETRITYLDDLQTTIVPYDNKGRKKEVLYVDDHLPFSLSGNYEKVYSFIGMYDRQMTLEDEVLRVLFPQCVAIPMLNDILINQKVLDMYPWLK